MKPKILIFLIAVTLASASSSSAAPDPNTENNLAVAIMTEAIVAEVETVIVGQIRADGPYRNAEPELPPASQFQMVVAVLGLNRIFVQDTLRSKEPLPPVLYMLSTAPTLGGKIKWTADTIADDGIRVIFLRAGEKLKSPRLLSGSKNQVMKTVEEFIDGVSPSELFKKLGVETYLNSKTFTQLYADRAAIRVDFPKPVMPPIQLSDPTSREILAANQKRADENYFQKLSGLLVLEKEFPSDLRLILNAYGIAESKSTRIERLTAALPRLKTQTGRKLCDTLLLKLRSE